MSRRARAILPGLAVVILFALPLLPEIVGSRRLVFRDAQVTHWPWHREAVRALASGQVPFVDAAASGGQPLLANPNAVLLYPTFLLERVLAPEAAFNLHYLLHVLWAFFGARALARRCGLGNGGSLVAGVAYAFSGMMLSYGGAFMNSSAAAAWLPWCGAAFLDLGRARGTGPRLAAATAAGLALGLQLYAGEPAISLMTLAFGTVLLASTAVAAPRGRASRLFAALAASVGAGALALAFAAPLLAPLKAVFSLTYRGQHLYSQRASGAAAFSAARALEWLLPRFGGNPDLLGGGANWLQSAARGDFVYIWCVSFGVVPLALVALGALRRDFWDRRSAALAGGGLLALLFSFGFSLPFYRLIFAVGFLRRLRYPIKFYLLTTVCVALLAGLAAESLARRRAGPREATVLVAALAFFAAAWALAAPGGVLERWAQPLARKVSTDPAPFLAVFRGLVRGDALLGALAILCLALVLRPRSSVPRDRSWVLGWLALVSAFPWGLPLFVTAPSRELVRPPALARRLEGPGRIYVSARLPRFDPAALRTSDAEELPRSGRVSRILVEQLVAATGAPFGARYIFEMDPDGSYGYFNRLAAEAADASTPAERDRLLILFGARWTLAEDGEQHPLFRPATGLAIAGTRLVLSEIADPVPELRWAGRAWRRSTLSDTLELVRSERFDPRRDVALPGNAPVDAAGAPVAARVEAEALDAGRAAATVEAEADGHLVFSRTYFPAWRALLDGRPAQVLVANARDLAVAVPAGSHRVEFEYDAAPFRRGVALQAAAFVLAAGVAIATRSGRGRQPQVRQQVEVDVRPAAV
jgi:hypothetical protein